MPEFTVDEILTAAELNKYENFNDAWIEYDNRSFVNGHPVNAKPIRACVIGEAFLNLGLVENGIDAEALSAALKYVKPDESFVTIRYTNYEGIRDEIEFRDLSAFINDLNGFAGYRGKKRIVRLARKYFSKSLQQKVSF